MNTLKDQSVKRDSFDGSRTGIRSDETPHSDAVQGRVGEAVGNLGEAATNIRSAASHAVPAAKEQLGRATDAVTQKTHSIEQSLAECVRDKPLNSMLMAAGIGMLVGVFMFRR